MKNLKSILLSLMAIGMITVLLTSCEREIIFNEEVKEIIQNESNEVVAKKLSGDIDFKNFVSITDETLVKLDRQQNANAQSYLKEYEEKSNRILDNLYEKYPKLENLKDNELTDLFNSALEISEENTGSFKKSTGCDFPCSFNSRNCRVNCQHTYLCLNACDWDAALSQIENCNGNQNCIDAAYEWYNQAAEDNYEYFLNCRYDCPRFVLLIAINP